MYRILFAYNPLKNTVFGINFLENLCTSSPQIHQTYQVSECSYEYSNEFPKCLEIEFPNYFSVYPDFISTEEEESLLAEIEPIMKRKRYEFDHWDNAIHGFKETEKSEWNPRNSSVLERLKGFVFRDSRCLPHAHVLDLHEEGHIKPHIDSVRFCGEIITGINLLSHAVMRLQYKSSYYCDVLVDRRSMYAMRGPARHEFTHEILPADKSFFKGSEVGRKRRIAVILRSEVDEEEN